MDRYDTVRVIGQGASGTCHLVKEKATGRLFVMKVMRRSAFDEGHRDPMQEVHVQSAIKHPNTIRLQDYFMSCDQKLCMVLEYADGGDLDALIRSCQQTGRELDEAEVLDFFLQLCLAVHACHKLSLIHRDLKLQNVFLTATGVVKLGDFGVSRVVGPHLDLARTLIGTPFYLSPEVLQSQPYGVKSDVWALGVVLYELMALHRPFQARDIAELKADILALKYDSLPERFSTDLRMLVTSMLQLDATQRPTVEMLLNSKVLRRRQRQWLQGGPDVHVPEEYVQCVAGQGLLTVSLDKAERQPLSRSGSESEMEGSPTEGRSSPEAEAEPVRRAARSYTIGQYKGSNFLTNLALESSESGSADPEEPAGLPRSVSTQCPKPGRLASLSMLAPLRSLRSRSPLFPTPRNLCLDHASLSESPPDAVLSARGSVTSGCSTARRHHRGSLVGLSGSFSFPESAPLERCGGSFSQPVHPLELERSPSTMRHRLKPLASPKCPDTPSPTSPGESVCSVDMEPSAGLPTVLVHIDKDPPAFSDVDRKNTSRSILASLKRGFAPFSGSKA